jgi:hypothetical protein
MWKVSDVIPQSLRDVLNPAHRHAGQIHLDQRLLDRALTPLVALDDRRLEGLRPKVPERPASLCCSPETLAGAIQRPA